MGRNQVSQRSNLAVGYQHRKRFWICCQLLQKTANYLARNKGMVGSKHCYQPLDLDDLIKFPILQYPVFDGNCMIRKEFKELLIELDGRNIGGFKGKIFEKR